MIDRARVDRLNAEGGSLQYTQAGFAEAESRHWHRILRSGLRLDDRSIGYGSILMAIRQKSEMSSS